MRARVGQPAVGTRTVSEAPNQLGDAEGHVKSEPRKDAAEVESDEASTRTNARNYPTGEPLRGPLATRRAPEKHTVADEPDRPTRASPAVGAPPSQRPLKLALRRRRRLRTGITQLSYVLVAFALGLALPQLSFWFTVSSARAVDFLLAVGIGMMTFIGVVYSLLFLVVQFGSTTFTPRLNLFRDAPIVWHAFGFYTGVIVFSLTAAFSIGKDTQTSGLVPIAVMLALLVTIALFRALQTAAFRSVQLAPTLAQIRKRGREVIAEIHPTVLETDAANSAPADGALPGEVKGAGHEVQWHGDSEVLQMIDVPRLVHVAKGANVVVELPLAPGDTVAAGSVLAVLHGDGGADGQLDEHVRKAMTLGLERTFEQDPRFALRILADIALRALSPAVNDPTTATEALDSIDSLLRILLTRDLGAGRITDPDGASRILYLLPDWDEYVGLALDEVIDSSSASTQARARIERLLADLITLAPRMRRDPLESRLLRMHVGEALHTSV